MSNWVERREFIPVSETPAEMPEGIAAKYYVRWPGSFHEITQDCKTNHEESAQRKLDGHLSLS